MFKLNFKIALRNLWKNRTYTTINVLGLAAGLAGFMVILLYINKETGYDKWDPALKRTYMVAVDFTQNGAENKGSKIKALFAKMVKEQFPSVEAISIGALHGRANLRVEQDQKVIKEKLSSVSMDSNFFKVYPLKAVSGRMTDVFLGKNSIAISKTAAQKLFGNQDPLNKILIENRGINMPEERMVIKAVWDDVKQTSYFGFDVFYPEDLSVYGEELLYRNFSTMIKLREGSDNKKILNKINDAYIIELAKFLTKNSKVNFKPSKEQALNILRDKEGITAIKLIVEPIPDLNLGTFYSTSAKQTTIYILISLASFLIIISCINYTNLALVLAQGRAREVGVKKVLGAHRLHIVKQFFAETAIQCLLAYLIALMLTELFLPSINHTLSAQLSLFKSADIIGVLGQAFMILIAVIFLSGTYPAVVLAGFLPVKVLKGNFSTEKHIGNLRKFLVVCQFTTAIALVISFLVMYAQLNYMKQKDLGLKPAQLMTLDIAKYENRNLNPEKFQTIKNRLLAINGVLDITRASEEPVNDSGFSDDISFANKTLGVESRYVDPNYIAVIGGEILEGRDFSNKLMATDTVQSILLNEAAFHKLGLKTTNEYIDVIKDDHKLKFKVIGKVKDIQAYGFDKPVNPTVYFVSDYRFHWRGNIILRLSTHNLSSTIEQIKKTWQMIEPGKDPYYAFADEAFEKMNKSYEISQKIIFSFGMLTLIVSVFGLIGFAAYSAKIRVKEVALRRVLGASTSSLLKLLNKDFLILVMVANIFADLLAFIYMKKWFAGIAYRIDMPFGIFIMANLAIVLLTIITVSWQSLRAVNSKPAKVLKYE
jgi:putative ABC transport system permease protein